MDGCTNGQWMDRNGKCHQLFTCKEGKGLYYPVNRLTVHEGVLKQTQKNCKNNKQKTLEAGSWDFINIVCMRTTLVEQKQQSVTHL